MSEAVAKNPAADAAPRHGRLFELIRQHNIAASAPVQPHLAAQVLREAAKSPRATLLPQEQQALGITASFGR